MTDEAMKSNEVDDMWLMIRDHVLMTIFTFGSGSGRDVERGWGCDEDEDVDVDVEGVSSWVLTGGGLGLGLAIHGFWEMVFQALRECLWS